ncbi:Tubulin polymerization-promoting protein member 2 [Pleodorina starrii]|nr:Tubulin polymerization-promoting protein member 2 [Pleodorina starrii]
MSDDADEITDDFADLVGEDSVLGQNSSQPIAPKKTLSRTSSKPSSKAPSDLSAEDSLFASGSRPASRRASTVPSVAPADESSSRRNDALRAPPKPTPTPSAVPAAARPPSARPSTLSSAGRPASSLANTASDDFADLLAPSPEKSSASLPREPSSRPSSGLGTAAAAPRPPSAQASTRLSPAGSGAPTPAALSRPESVSGYSRSSLGGGSGGGGSFTGSFSPGATLGPPEASPSPRASGAPPTPRSTTFAAAGGGGAAGGGQQQPHRALNRSDQSRISQVECHIPTPFELFRLYDADFNGRVTQEEFYCMLRDLDGHPLHYAPHNDPEHRLARLKEKRRRKDAERQTREEKLALAEMHKQATEASKGEMAEQVAQLAARVAELDGRIAEEEAEARRLANHPDEAVRVTPEVRQHRAQWRQWVSEEFARADLAGNGILSIDEFYMYFYSKLCFRFPVMRTGVNPGALLFNIFVRYCSIGRGAVGGRNEDMLSHQFSKLCKDAGLINGKTLTRAAVDIIYHRSRAADESLETYKPKAGVAATARMYYPQFLFALDKIAEKRRSGFQEVVARLLSSVSTLPGPTFADFLIISGHDLGAGEQVPEFLTRHPLLPDNSHALRSLADNDMIRKMKQESDDALNLSMGLPPKSMDGGGLKAFLDAKKAGEGEGKQANGDDSGGGGAGGGGGNGGGGGGGTALQASVYGSLPKPSLEPDMLRQKKWERREPSELQRLRAAAVSRGVAPVLSPDCMHMVRALDPDQLMASLKRVYEAYTAWGGGVDRTALDRRRFSKVLRDALLISESGPLPTRKAEAVYDKILPASCRALNFIQFIEALRHVALHHRLSLNEVMEKLVAVGSPRPGP